MTLGYATSGDTEGDEGGGEGEGECDDDPCDGGKGPDFPLVQAIGDIPAPSVTDQDEIEKTFIPGELEGDLLQGYQCPPNIILAFVRDAFCPTVN